MKDLVQSLVKVLVLQGSLVDLLGSLLVKVEELLESFLMVEVNLGSLVLELLESFLVLLEFLENYSLEVEGLLENSDLEILLAAVVVVGSLQNYLQQNYLTVHVLPVVSAVSLPGTHQSCSRPAPPRCWESLWPTLSVTSCWSQVGQMGSEIINIFILIN